MKAPHRTRGFTLIELAVAAAIVAVLAGIALPSYSRHVLRTQRALARAALTGLAAQQEQRALESGTYARDFAKLVGIASAVYYLNRRGEVSAASGAESLYRLSLAPDAASSPSCALKPAAGYALLAMPVPGSAQARDTECATLCISASGLRGASGSRGAAGCWAQ